jgi:phospho-N-acetylmuramoyl-pentapeptide-transferase
MIYYIFYELIFNHSNQDWWLVKALNVFQYVTFRTAYASVTALLISLLSGRRVINALKKWNIGQQIREEGPQAHMAKQNTGRSCRAFMSGSLFSRRSLSVASDSPTIISSW